MDEFIRWTLFLLLLLALFASLMVLSLPLKVRPGSVCLPMLSQNAVVASVIYPDN